MANRELKKLSYRDVDILLSCGLIGIFGYTAWDSYRMSAERIGKKMATLSTAPGLMPFIVSILIIVCSVSVITHAARSGGRLRRPTDYFGALRGVFKDETGRSTLTIFSLLFLYIFGFIGNIPFVFATLLYVLLSLFVFKAGKPAGLVAIGVLYSVGVVLFFAKIVGTSFPVGLFIWR